MTNERYLNMIDLTEGWGLTRREGTLIVTALVLMAKNPDQPDLCRFMKTVGILMGIHAAGSLTDWQYEELHRLVDQIDTAMHDSESAYRLIEETFAEEQLTEGREVE